MVFIRVLDASPHCTLGPRFAPKIIKQPLASMDRAANHPHRSSAALAGRGLEQLYIMSRLELFCKQNAPDPFLFPSLLSHHIPHRIFLARYPFRFS